MRAYYISIKIGTNLFSAEEVSQCFSSLLHFFWWSGKKQRRASLYLQIHIYVLKKKTNQ